MTKNMFFFIFVDEHDEQCKNDFNKYNRKFPVLVSQFESIEAGGGVH